MSPTPREGEASGLDFRPSRALIRDRTIAELIQLHANAEELASATGMWSGIGARRRLRDAKNAETDLLRVLGFMSYTEFLSFVGPTASAAALAPAPVGPGPVVEAAPPPDADRVPAPLIGPGHPQRSQSDRDEARTRELERALGSARAEIEELRTKLAQNGHEPVSESVATGAPAPAIDAESVRAMQVGVERAAAELEALRGATHDLREMIVEIGAELIAARLEILVAQRRLQAQQDAGPAAG